MIVYAGGDVPPRSILEDLPEADLVVAADGGYDVAMALGQVIDVVVGDLDSIRILELPRHVLVHRHPPDKDATDLELALDLVLADNPDRVVVVGGTGGRHDHEVGTAALICAPRYAPIDEIDWISARGKAYVIRSRRIIHGDIGGTFSLIPIGGDVGGVTTSGLRWRLENEDLPFGSTRGVSNQLIDPIADIRVKTGVLLAVLPAAPQAGSAA